MSNACHVWFPHSMSALAYCFPDAGGNPSQNAHVKRASPNSADDNAFQAAHECLALSCPTSLQQELAKFTISQGADANAI